MIGNILKIVGGFFEPVAKLIDDLHTSDEEKLKIKENLALIEQTMSTKILEYDNKVMELQSKVITAEAMGQSWIQRNWRPITMLVFLFLIFCDHWGWLAYRLSDEVLGLMKLGLCGYVAGRTAEKVLPSAMREFGKFFRKS